MPVSFPPDKVPSVQPRTLLNCKVDDFKTVIMIEQINE